MLFMVIRLAFWGLALIIGLLLLRKSHILHKRKWSLISFGLSIVCLVLSAMLPIENIFITFSTVEASYSYSNVGTVQLVISGEKTDFVIGQNGDTDTYTIIPKSDNGWKLGRGLDTKRVLHRVSDGIIVTVYRYKNSTEHYITILDTNGGISEIKDNYNLEFQYLQKPNSALNKTFYTYFAYVNGFDEKYVVTVNGKTIST